MSRTEQKCLVVSAGMHGLLVVLLVVGSAFFVPTEKMPQKLPTIEIVPDELIDDLLAGGGGNPNVKPVEGKQKGDTLEKPPELPPAPKEKPPEPKQTKPVEVKPQVKETKPVEPKPEQSAKPKETKPDKPLLKEILKPASDKPSPNAIPSFLKPVSAEEYRKAAAEETARQWAQSVATARQAIGRSKEGLREVKRGFKDGTVVEPYGPGGKAYAPYAAFVKVVYDNAWSVDSMMDDGATCVARVTIARDGDVLSARIITPSGNSTLDRSVQRVLNSVRTIGRPFPQGATENERSFTINFNLKNKQGLG